MSRGAYAGPRCLSLAALLLQHHRGPFIGDPTSPRFISRTIPIQLTGLLVLLAEILHGPIHSGGPFQNESLCPRNRPVVPVFRFPPPLTEDGFSHHQHCGAQFMAASVEVARWVYFPARRQNSLLALIAGTLVSRVEPGWTPA